MGNQSDFDLSRGATDEPRTGVSQIRERARPARIFADEDARDPVLDWDTHHAGSLQLPTTHRPKVLAHTDGELAPREQSPPAAAAALRRRADAFSLEDEIDRADSEAPNHTDGEEEHAQAVAAPTASLRREPRTQPSRSSPRRRAVAFAFGLAVLVTLALVGLSGHTAHHTVTAAASLGTRSPLLTNPLTSVPKRSTERTSTRHAAKPTAAARKPRHRVQRKPWHGQRHTARSPKGHTAATSTAEHAPATPIYTTPAYTAPPPTPTPTSDTGSSSGTTSHSSSAKQPAFGAAGTLGPGSSPNG